MELSDKLKKELTSAEAEALGRQVFASLMLSDNYCAMVGLFDHKRVIGVYDASGEKFVRTLVREKMFRLAQDIERDLLAG